ncbi:hypothetical protein PYW08_012042 [Mythimna loreyi]|uniref:Uncharacterized protein n=1 Tax=Mythimna loreyi TaxID=667449 RepID=A0ACC2QLK2_9NEOP|nr:hypothetical protein PYW08_012042 [Mythimna loreyi]
MNWEVDILDTRNLRFEGDFDTQVQDILSFVRLTAEKVHNLRRLFDDLKQALQYVAPGCTIEPFGSVVTGLGIKTSDVDCYVALPNGEQPHIGHVIRARNVLNRYHRKFSQIIAITTAKVPIVKFFHLPTQCQCDVNFKSPAGVRNSQLVAFLLHYDKRALPLAVLIKYWSKVHKFTGTNLMGNYSLILMLIFYLQLMNIIPSIYELQRNVPPYYVDSWNTAFDASMTSNTRNSDTLYELLGGFFKCYSTFNYKENMISPYMGRVINKKCFDNFDMPEEYSLYKNQVSKDVRKKLKTDSKICIQDPFEHNRNCSGGFFTATAMVAHQTMAPQNVYISLVCGVAVLVFCCSGAVCAPLCLEGDFDSQLQQILRAQMLSAQDPSVTQALGDVRATLDQRWPGYDLTLCGSLAIGVGTILSDIDLVVKLPNFNSSAGLYVLEETDALLNNQPELYSNCTYKHIVNPKVSSTFFRFSHIPTKREVDIEFNEIGDIAVENKKITKYYFELDERFKALGIFLKYWSKIQDITGHGPGSLPGYVLYLLIIFFLQQKNMAPPAYVLQVNTTPRYIDGWNVAFNELPYSTNNTENLHQLLGGFFKYYSEYEFDKYIVSVFTGRPIPKNAFSNINNFPVAYTLFNSLNRTMQLAIKNDLDAEMSVQDVFLHDTNNADLVSHELVTKFKYLMKLMATMFEDLPSERILCAILDTETNKESYKPQ